MQIFELEKIVSEANAKDRAWSEFIRIASLSMGVYRLKVGQLDGQRPHHEDEVYYVLSGRAQFQVGERQQPVGPGSIIFVERDVEHRFQDVTEALTLLVFFAPPEGSVKPN